MIKLNRIRQIKRTATILITPSVSFKLVLTWCQVPIVLRNLVNLVFPKREVQHFSLVTRSCIGDIIIIPQIRTNSVSAPEFSGYLSLIILVLVNIEL